MIDLRNKRSRRIALAVIVTVAISAVSGVYLCDYYPADAESIHAFTAESSVTVFRMENGYFVAEPETADTGLIFYPGGKVAHDAYLPLMDALASRGILCVLVEMPCRLAVLDMDAAEGIPEQYPQIENWYIGGHSLGGAMAASYLSEHSDEFEGLVLLGAYSTADLSETGLSVLSVYGSEDLVMNREKYNTCLDNLPEDFTQTVLDGGCHAYFGMYGAQDGDGTPRITNEEQILLTADAILAMISEQNS